MKFRTSYLVGLMVTVLAVFSTTYFIDPAIAADAPKLKPLKIMGPDGKIRQVNHQYGPTTSRDTFWSIAQKVRPDASVSVYQVMAALFDANPHAFNSDSYNSLERGMILLIPSKEVMLSIPNSMAIARAQRSDKQARSATRSTPKAATKVTTAKVAVTPPVVIVENKVTPPKTPVVETPVVDKPKMLSSDATARLEAAESKNLSLTDELARTQDQLTVRNTDVEALKAKVEELNQQIAVLEETLQASKLQNQALKAEVDASQTTEIAEVDTETQVPAEPDDLWRSIVNSPGLLIAAAVIPALFLLLAIFWLLRRKRNKERREMEAQHAAIAAGGAAAGATIMGMDEDDDIHDMAVHLDTDHADSIDSLLDMGSVDLQPEHDLTDAHDQMDMASEMFIDPGVTPEPEGQSLDDLWAEAMGDQEEYIPEDKPKSGNILEEADLDALLAGLDEEESSGSQDDLSELESNFGNDLAQDDDFIIGSSTDDLTDFTVEAPQNADDDLDALLNEFSVSAPKAPEAPVVTEDPAADITEDTLSAAIAAELDAELDELGVEETDDIDALLADFAKPTPAVIEPDLGAEIAAELDAELDELGVEETDDIDALLADFAKPTPAVIEPDLGAEIAAELDAELDELGVEETDDIDALLADFDKPTPDVVEPDLGAEIAAELDAELDELGVEDSDDIDALLADFDKPVTDVVEPDLGAEIAAELDAELDELDVEDSDDIDALLADFDTPAPAAELDAEPEEMKTEVGDDIASLLASFDTETEVKAEEPQHSAAVAAEAELEASLPEELVEEEDLDTLLAQFDLPEQSEADADEINFDMETAAIAAAVSAKEKETSFFKDLKATKSKDPHVLDWDSELDFAPKAKPAAIPTVDTKVESDAALDAPVISTRKPLDFSQDLKPDTNLTYERDADEGLDLSDDNVLAAFAANTDVDDEEVLTSEDSFSLVDDNNLTVDEALAALDAQESRKAKRFVSDHDLTHFQNENGFIDIDKLLNDAEEDNSDTDLYSEVDVEMSDVGALIGNAAMIDVDDEENSVNAKLDLARAYIEIDDSDSAKALLKEVQIDGNGRQQEEAQRLLKEIR